jgi:hypothetical protein
MPPEPFFPQGCFSPDPRSDHFSAQVYTQFLARLGETPLYTSSVPNRDVYRFFALERCGLFVRLECHAQHAEAVSKNILVETAGAALTRVAACQANMPVPERGMRTMKRLMAACRFWDLESCVPPVGLDGWHCILEARSGQHYHIVDRWCPEGTDFGRLCNYFVRLGRLTQRRYRPWWRHRFVSAR